MTTVLFGGTALGWYRECGFIPYTTDVDLATPIKELNTRLDEALKCVPLSAELRAHVLLHLPLAAHSRRHFSRPVARFFSTFCADEQVARPIRTQVDFWQGV